MSKLEIVCIYRGVKQTQPSVEDQNLEKAMRIYLKREDIIFICSQRMKVHYQDLFTCISPHIYNFCIYLITLLLIHSIMLIKLMFLILLQYIILIQ